MRSNDTTTLSTKNVIHLDNTILLSFTPIKWVAPLGLALEP